MASSSSFFSPPPSHYSFYCFDRINRCTSATRERITGGSHAIYKYDAFRFLEVNGHTPTQYSGHKIHLGFDCKLDTEEDRKKAQEIIAKGWDVIVPILIKYSHLIGRAKVGILTDMKKSYQTALQIIDLPNHGLNDYEFKEGNRDHILLYTVSREEQENRKAADRKFQKENYDRFTQNIHITLFINKITDEKFDEHKKLISEINEALTNAGLKPPAKIPDSDFPITGCLFASTRYDLDADKKYVIATEYDKYQYQDFPFNKAMVAPEYLHPSISNSSSLHASNELKEEKKAEKIARTLTHTYDLKLMFKNIFDEDAQRNYWNKYESPLLNHYIKQIQTLFEPTAPSGNLLSRFKEISANFLSQQRDILRSDLKEEFDKDVDPFFKKLANDNSAIDIIRIVHPLKEKVNAARTARPSP